MFTNKPEKQLVRIAFDPGFYMSVDNQTNELRTSGSSLNGWAWDVSESSMVWSGTTTQIVFEWEILKTFFDNYNVVPKWILGNYTEPNFDEEAGEWTTGLITTVKVLKFQIY